MPNSSSCPALARRPSRLGHTLTAVALTVMITLTACGTGSSPRGELADNQHILATCDPSIPPASLVEIDGTRVKWTATESIVRTTAICSGHLRVMVFSASSAATTILFDGPLQLDGTTDNARLKRVPGVVTDVMTPIRQGYGLAVAALPGGGSDITAQYRLAAEWIRGSSFSLSVWTTSFPALRSPLTTSSMAA